MDKQLEHVSNTLLILNKNTCLKKPKELERGLQTTCVKGKPKPEPNLRLQSVQQFLHGTASRHSTLQDKQSQ